MKRETRGPEAGSVRGVAAERHVESREAHISAERMLFREIWVTLTLLSYVSDVLVKC